MWKCPLLLCSAVLLHTVTHAYLSPYPGSYQGYPGLYEEAYQGAYSEVVDYNSAYPQGVYQVLQVPNNQTQTQGAEAGAAIDSKVQEEEVDRTFTIFGLTLPNTPSFPLGTAIAMFLAIIMVSFTSSYILSILYLTSLLQLDAAFLLFPSTVEVEVNSPVGTVETGNVIPFGRKPRSLPDEGEGGKTGF